MAAAAAVAILAAQPTTSARQFSSAPGDITSLERRVADARARIVSAQASASSTANPGELLQLETELDAIATDVSFLAAKTRHGDRVAERDQREVADRLGRLEARLSGRPIAPGRGDAGIPVGTELDLRLQTPVSSKDAVVEQRVDAATLVSLTAGGVLAVPAGSAVQGYVVAVDRASRLDRRGSLMLKFTRLIANGATHDVTLSVTQALESDGIRGEAARIGIGAGVGAIVGGILGGTKGAVAGILIGGAGALLATDGEDVDLPAGTVLRVRFDTPLDPGR